MKVNAAGLKEELETLRLGVELGMTLLDMAEMYGEGNAEELVGQAVKGIRDKEAFHWRRRWREGQPCPLHAADSEGFAVAFIQIFHAEQTDTKKAGQKNLRFSAQLFFMGFLANPFYYKNFRLFFFPSKVNSTVLSSTTVSRWIVLPQRR